MFRISRLRIHGGLRHLDSWRTSWMTLTKLVQKISRIPFEVRWFRAYSGFGKITPQIQLKRLSRLKPRNGPKQIILIQIGNVLSSLGRKDDAIVNYSEAVNTEEMWGGRKNKKVSEYIQLYGRYRIHILRYGYSKTPQCDVIEIYNALKACRVPSSLKDYHLPLPQAPDGKVY